MDGIVGRMWVTIPPKPGCEDVGRTERTSPYRGLAAASPES